MPIVHAYRSNRPIVELDAATIAWVAAVVSNGGSVSDARKTIVNTLIVGLKADGLWTKLERLWLFAAENEGSALTDLVATGFAVLVSTPSFTTNLGYTGATGAYIRSDILGTNLVIYTQDLAHAIVWATDTGQFTGTLVGRDVGSGRLEVYPRYTDNTAYYAINQSTEPGVANTDASGCWVVSRTAASGAGAVTLYRNGSSSATDSSASTAIPSSYIIFLSTAPFGVNDYTGNIAAGGYGTGLDSTETSNFYTRLRTYMTAVGVP